MRRRDTPCNRSAHLNNRWAEPHPTVKAEGNRPATTRTTRSVCAGAGERVDLPALRATNARAGAAGHQSELLDIQQSATDSGP
jgi:hypothetical protein